MNTDVEAALSRVQTATHPHALSAMSAQAPTRKAPVTPDDQAKLFFSKLVLKYFNAVKRTLPALEVADDFMDDVIEMVTQSNQDAESRASFMEAWDSNMSMHIEDETHGAKGTLYGFILDASQSIDKYEASKAADDSVAADGSSLEASRTAEYLQDAEDVCVQVLSIVKSMDNWLVSLLHMDEIMASPKFSGDHARMHCKWWYKMNRKVQEWTLSNAAPDGASVLAIMNSVPPGTPANVPSLMQALNGMLGEGGMDSIFSGAEGGQIMQMVSHIMSNGEIAGLMEGISQDDAGDSSEALSSLFSKLSTIDTSKIMESFEGGAAAQ